MDVERYSLLLTCFLFIQIAAGEDFAEQVSFAY